MKFVFSKNTIFKKLFYPICWNAGRSNSGKVSILSKGSKKTISRFCYIDLIRKTGSGKVVGLVKLVNKNYYSAVIYSTVYGFFVVVAPQNLEPANEIQSLSNIFNVGNSMFVTNVPVGYKVYNISLFPSARAVYTRSAGCGSLVVAREFEFSLLKLASGFIRKFSNNSTASFGVISANFNSQKFIKAGSFVNYGQKPKVRGVAKNPVDHPHGGGEGKKSKPAAPRSPWGWLTVRYSSIRKLIL